VDLIRPSPPRRFVFLDEDPLPVSAAVTVVDGEDAATVGQQVPVPWFGKPLADDESGSGLTNFYLDQEEPWIAQCQAVSIISNVFWFNDEIARLGVEQEEPWTAAMQAVTWTVRPFLDDEIGSQLTNFFLEQEEPCVPQSQFTYLASNLFSFNDEIAYFGAEQEEPWLAQVQQVAWTCLPFLYDEIGAQLTNFGVDQEEYWVVQCQSVSVNSTVFSFTEEGARLGIDQEDNGWTGQVQSTAWVASNFSVDDIAAFIVLDQEDPCLYLPTSAWTARTFLDDEIGSGLTNFFLEQEEFWTAQRQEVCWTAVIFSDGESVLFVAQRVIAPVIFIVPDRDAFFIVPDRPAVFQITNRDNVFQVPDR
jgi:hypothetical protein